MDGNLTKHSNSMEASCMTYAVDILVTYSDGAGWQVVTHSPHYFNLFYYIQLLSVILKTLKKNSIG